jgi:hypothetical protein
MLPSGNLDLERRRTPTLRMPVWICMRRLIVGLRLVPMLSQHLLSCWCRTIKTAIAFETDQGSLQLMKS